MRIINQEGELIEIENPNSLVSVGDRVTIKYYNGDYTCTSTFFIATMEIIPLIEAKTTTGITTGLPQCSEGPSEHIPPL